MKKTIIRSISLLIMIILLPHMTTASAPGNPRKGKYLYRKNCLNCHKFGTENQLGPDSKTRAEWERTFLDKNRSALQCANEWASLSEKDILDIFTHMHSHASDSPAPAACR